ncbi:hypothetical protein DHEL01_v205143 [Diaporthe helianthi]|uniref:Uncharacterized protein n=1 Tax=Diaporthe helianthi TaxID=158607 RepID=A0A2P5I1T2_DIAHE|nr:hypothetical protein DHEL01_v205143 [Diaporthe helianthi]
MASDAATNAVILEVLNRHLKNEPHEREEITINEAKHEIISSDACGGGANSAAMPPSASQPPIIPQVGGDTKHAMTKTSSR